MKASNGRMRRIEKNRQKAEIAAIRKILRSVQDSRGLYQVWLAKLEYATHKNDPLYRGWWRSICERGE